MPIIDWIQFTERATGLGHPTRPDVVNRPLRQLLLNSGVSPDDPNIAFLTGASLAAETAARIADVDAEESARIAADNLLAPLASPIFTGDPRGPTPVNPTSLANKAYVDAPHTHDTADIVSGVMATARLGSGSPSASTFLRGDQTWATPTGGGGGGGSIVWPMVFGDSTNMFVELPPNSVFASVVPVQFTVEWLTLVRQWSGFPGVFASGSGGDSFIVYLDSSGSPAFWPGPYTTAGTKVYNDMRVRRVSMTRDAGTVKTYVDGILMQTGTWGQTGTLAINTSLRRLMGDGGSEGMLGQALADVRFWSTVRTDQEVSDNAFVRLIGNETGLIAYWKFDEATGLTIADSTSGGANGTINNAHHWINGKTF